MVIRRILAQLEKHGTQRHSICVNNVELTAHNIVKLGKHTKNVSCLKTGKSKTKMKLEAITGSRDKLGRDSTSNCFRLQLKMFLHRLMVFVHFVYFDYFFILLGLIFC